MRVREKLLVVFGIIQSGLALLTLFLAVVIFFNFFDVQSILAIAQEFVDFYVTFLLVFGVFLIVSGLFLINEWMGQRK